MRKLKKLLKDNQGNSFIVVVATVSFLAILVAALLVAIAMIYRLKAYDINSRDNFYYLEQAMDEIYAGVGSDSMKILNDAYDDTVEVLVYYDTKKKSYVTMTNEEANKILRRTYMYKLKEDPNYKTQDAVLKRLNGFLSYPYKKDITSDTITDKEGIQLAVGNVVHADENVTLYNLVLKRQAEYSTVNARSAKESNEKGKDGVAAGDTFVQTISTDLVIGQPTFDVNFNSNATDLDELYEYTMIADMGVEITGADGGSAIGNKVNITGNLYAGADFYNKSYNENPEDGITLGYTTFDGSRSDLDLAEGSDDDKKTEAENHVKEQRVGVIQKVNSYSDSKLKACDGVNEKSRYSGLYVDGAELVVSSDRLIIPGSLALMNCADATISTVSNASDTATDLWVDGIVLDGYALKQNTEGTIYKGSKLYMKANCYVYDDLELNANSSNVLLNGQYYGYNNGTTDQRVFTKNTNAGYLANKNHKTADGKAVEGSEHYNSSAIILNGENTSLDFSLVESLYVAGQSYIETSKQTKVDKKNEKTIEYQVKTTTNEKGETVNLSTPLNLTDSYYVESDSYSEKKDSFYSVENEGNKEAIQDYKTGEAISIKSNQLAYGLTYISKSYITDTVVNGKQQLYVNLPANLRNLEPYKNIWSDLSKVPIIKTVVSGKNYYFFDFEHATVNDPKTMNQFIEEYAALFSDDTIDNTADLTDERTLGEKNDLPDVTDYDYFKVEMLNVNTDTEKLSGISTYTNSAITSKIDNNFTIKASEQNVNALLSAGKNINAAKGGTTVTVDGVTKNVAASNVTTALNSQYKEMKWLLTKSSSNSDFINAVKSLSEDYITPINHYFRFNYVNADNSGYCPLECGYGVWICDGDIEVGADGYVMTNGKHKNTRQTYDTPFKNKIVRGVVLCTGDVSFSNNVKEFDGLIITGGKIIINNFSASNKSMALSANPEVVKSVLRECDASRGNKDSKNYSYVCDAFRWFESTYVETEKSDDNDVTSMKSVSSVQFEDIISFDNWKKNVEDVE